jgi:hypothetical protein
MRTSSHPATSTSALDNEISQSIIFTLASVTAFQEQLFHLHDLGMDQAFIDVLPVFLYRNMVGGKHDPFDCVVCLCEFSPDDQLRLLPKCSHAFHLEYIDMSLLSHSTYPLCRRSLLAELSPMSTNVNGNTNAKAGLGQRRCHSMGPYSYIMDRHASLCITIKSPKKKHGAHDEDEVVGAQHCELGEASAEGVLSGVEGSVALGCGSSFGERLEMANILGMDWWVPHLFLWFLAMQDGVLLERALGPKAKEFENVGIERKKKND